MRTSIVAGFAFVFALCSAARAAAQVPAAPETVLVASGRSRLRAVVWRPAGKGPFPAILFNHGSYRAADSAIMAQPSSLGPLFAGHGYIFFALYRRGAGASRSEGTADGDVMARAFARDGAAGRNRVQLELLDDELHDAITALATLRAMPDVDAKRIGLLGHSFGGALTLLLAAQDSMARASVVFGASAASWQRSPALRTRLEAAVARTTAPVMFVHAANDYSVAPGQVLAADMQRRGKPNVLKIYPAVGRTSSDGHNLIYLSMPAWEADVFAFLAARLRPAHR
jgi:dienelactone hydrolase